MSRKERNSHFLAIDTGRSLIKAKTGSHEISFTHGLSKLTETEYKDIVAREGHEDIVRVSNVPYAIGKTAIKRGYQSRQTTAARYTKEYFGVLLAVCLFRLYQKPVNNITVYACHPPIALQYRPDIIKSAKGKWKVECQGETRTNIVTFAACGDEPVMGSMNLLISPDGQSYARSDIKEGDSLTIDIGGETIDISALDNGRVDYSSILSVSGGVIAVEELFIKLFRARYSKKLKTANFLPPEKIRHALRYGHYDAGAFGMLECKKQVDEATNEIVVRINDLIEQFGGLTNYHNIVLTGGGGGLLFERICSYFDHASIQKELNRDFFHLADSSDDVHLANVRGAFKVLKMLEKANKI